MTVREILEQKFDSDYLIGFKNGWFDPAQNKLYAYSVVLADDEQFKSNLHFIMGYSFVGLYDDEPRRKYGGDGTFQYKELP